MLTALDAHVHIYPFHDAALLLRTLHANLLGHTQADATAALLAERHDCDAFDALAASAPPGLACTLSADGSCLSIETGSRPALLLFAGRQVVTSERLEILALLTRSRIPDGVPARETVSRILAAGGVPVVSWAPGKWFFARGRVVRALLDAFTPGKLLLGDTSLRATLWPTPRLMRAAANRGFHVLCGSDPLPVPGEEGWAGRYATVIEGAFDPAAPTASMRRLLFEGGTPRPCGRRASALRMVLRVAANARAARR